MEKLDLSRKSLNKFGITMGVAFLVISCLILIRHRHSIMPTSIISALFFIFGLVLPGALKYVYIAWMKFAFMLGWVNTRLLLLAIFYLLFTPLGLIMRLFGADLLDKKINRKKQTFWLNKEREAFDPLNYERQY
jgi:hypothetical protein